MEKTDKKNILVFGIGLALIVLVAAFTFLKPIIFNRKNKTANQSAEDLAYSKSVKNAKKIDSEDLWNKVLQGEKIMLIDIRDKDEFLAEHMTDSVNVQPQNMSEALNGLEKEKTYVLIDDGLAFQAAYFAGGLFQEKGFKNSFYLTGGFPAWKNKINLTVSKGDPTSFTDQAKVNYISGDDLKKIIETEKNLFIIDLRSNDQFKTGHIKNAINISADDLEKERKSIPLGKKIIIYEDYNLLAFEGAVKLYDMGFFNTFILSDGLNTWKQKGYEIVK